MRRFHCVTLLTATLMFGPLSAFAATPDKAKAPHETHATTGTVKSVDATTLVISRPNKKTELSFLLNGSTRRDGSIVPGAPVSVRYKDEGTSHVATAVAVRQTSHVAAHK